MKTFIVDLWCNLIKLFKAVDVQETMSIAISNKFDSRKYSFFGMRKDDKKSVQQTVKELRAIRDLDLKIFKP